MQVTAGDGAVTLGIADAGAAEISVPWASDMATCIALATGTVSTVTAADGRIRITPETRDNVLFPALLIPA